MSPKLPNPPPKPPSPPVSPDGPEHVVRLAALGVGQDLVGLVDLLEPEVRAGVLVDVRVPLLGEPPEGALDLGVRGVPPDAEDRVEVAFLGGHSAEVYREVGGQCGEPFTIDRCRPG